MFVHVRQGERERTRERERGRGEGQERLSLGATDSLEINPKY